MPPLYDYAGMLLGLYGLIRAWRLAKHLVGGGPS
jgi:hypothetical protein